MIQEKINQLLKKDGHHYLSYAEITAALAMADINILSVETIDGVELTNIPERERVTEANPGDNCEPDRYWGAAITPRVLVVYEYRWRYGSEPQQTKWSRAAYMWQGSCYIAPRDIDLPKTKTNIYLDEAAIMLEIMERVAGTRRAISEATGAPRHGRI